MEHTNSLVTSNSLTTFAFSIISVFFLLLFLIYYKDKQRVKTELSGTWNYNNEYNIIFKHKKFMAFKNGIDDKTEGYFVFLRSDKIENHENVKNFICTNLIMNEKDFRIYLELTKERKGDGTQLIKELTYYILDIKILNKKHMFITNVNTKENIYLEKI